MKPHTGMFSTKIWSKPGSWFALGILSVAAFAIPPEVFAQHRLNIASGKQKVALLELYTSEGCSSCPPAESWIANLKHSERLWDEVVPVAFHVAYWDYLGWKDPFAEEQFSQRQRALAREAGSRVYTPGFFLDGQEWRGFFQRSLLPGPKSLSPGILSVQVSSRDQLQASFDGHKLNAPTLNIAILGFGKTSQVRAGENRGRKLHHDFVVLDFLRLPAQQTAKTWMADLSGLDLGTEKGTRAIAAWITEHNSYVPVQAAGGWIE